MVDLIEMYPTPVIFDNNNTLNNIFSFYMKYIFLDYFLVNQYFFYDI